MIFGIKVFPDDWRCPKILDHLFDPDSRKLGFGWWLFIVASTFRWNKIITVKAWLICVALSTILIGGGTVVDDLIRIGKEYIALRFGAKEVKPDAPSSPA